MKQLKRVCQFVIFFSCCSLGQVMAQTTGTVAGQQPGLPSLEEAVTAKEDLRGKAMLEFHVSKN